MTNNDQFHVNMHDFWSYLIKQRGILNNCQKVQRIYTFKTVYVFRKKGRLVNIGIADVWIAIALNCPPEFGKIQYTKTSEHLCVLNKVLQLVLHVVRVLT